MKNIIYLATIALTMLCFNACESSDCVCTYYDENNNVLANESWDGDVVGSCSELEQITSIEEDNQIIVASSVSCRESW